MTIDKSAALIAAETFLYIERVKPGGQNTTAARIYPDQRAYAAQRIAAKLDATASNQERRDLLNEDDMNCADYIRPLNMTPPDLKAMSASDRLAYINSRKSKK